MDDVWEGGATLELPGLLCVVEESKSEEDGGEDDDDGGDDDETDVFELDLTDAPEKPVNDAKTLPTSPAYVVYIDCVCATVTESQNSAWTLTPSNSARLQ
jgi:hypothetical protein